MLRWPLLPLAAIAALMLSATAEAQDAPAAPPVAATTGHRAYSADQMHDFARATVELQAQGSQDPAEMTRTIRGAGMSVEDYNQMGDAMRADPALASSLNPYLDSANSERVARFYRAQAQVQPAAHSTGTRHPTSSHTVSSHKVSSHKATASRSHTTRHGKAHARTAQRSHGKAANSRHQATRSASHAASSRHAASSKTKSRHAATPAHASKHHRRS
jgi:hypothetical protein